jgi:hypothetical protein
MDHGLGLALVMGHLTVIAKVVEISTAREVIPRVNSPPHREPIVANRRDLKRVKKA